MDDWILQAVALLLTAPWWGSLVHHLVRSVRAAAEPPVAERTVPVNALALEHARAAWGAPARKERVPRRLGNTAWETGTRRPAEAPTRTVVLRAGSPTSSRR